MTERFEIKHTGGVGAFFYAAIPGVIAGALLMYFAFFVGIIDWQKAQRIEARMDNRVGVHGELKAPVDLVITKRGCVVVDRAYLDGETGTMYMKNLCNGRVRYYESHENAIAPDGTIIWTHYDNAGGTLEPGDTFEYQFSLPDDPRIVKIVVWATGEVANY